MHSHPKRSKAVHVGLGDMLGDTDLEDSNLSFQNIRLRVDGGSP